MDIQFLSVLNSRSVKVLVSFRSLRGVSSFRVVLLTGVSCCFVTAIILYYSLFELMAVDDDETRGLVLHKVFAFLHCLGWNFKEIHNGPTGPNDASL